MLRRIKLWLGLGVVAALMLPTLACAQADLTIYASPQYEYDSNIFDLPSGQSVPGTTNTKHSDSDVVYRGGINTDYLWGQQGFYAHLEGAEYRYQDFTQLNHDEYTGDLGWKWVLSRDLSGSFDISRAKAMVPFSSLLIQQGVLILQTVQKETAAAKYQFNPDWRIDGSIAENKTYSPVPDAAALNLRDTTLTGMLTYTRNARLTGGVSATYVSGKYQDGVDNLAPAYHEETLAGVANYAAKGLSSFSGLLGYTKRSSLTGTNDVSSVTGSFDYKRVLTGKTSMDLSVSRTVNANITNTGSEVDTTAGGSLKWQATYKIGVAVAYNWTSRFLPDQNQSAPGFVAIGTDRTDHQQYASLNIEYQPLRWLEIRPYFNYQTRHSNAQFGDFNATIIGIIATAKYQRGAVPN